MTRIYLSPPHLGERELELVRDAFASNWIAPLGPHVDAFERELAAAVGVPAAAALSSGTAALHLALTLLGVGPGDEVICPTITFCASANPVRYLGADPVFVDVDPATWTMDPGLVAEELAACAKRGKLPRAVVTVDLYGQCADHDGIAAACAPYGIPIVEEDELTELIGREQADVAVFAYSDVPHEQVMHLGSRCIASGADFWLQSARSTMLRSSRPVIAVTAGGRPKVSSASRMARSGYRSGDTTPFFSCEGVVRIAMGVTSEPVPAVVGT